MSVNRIPKEDIEYFDSGKEITLEEDRVETDIHIIGWGKKMRIRALSFAQMELINKKSTDEKGDMDHEQWVYWTIKEGVVRPMMTIAQARDLSENNGSFVRDLANEIWELGRISKKMWDAYILEQKRLAEIEKTGNPNADETITSDEL